MIRKWFTEFRTNINGVARSGCPHMRQIHWFKNTFYKLRQYELFLIRILMHVCDNIVTFISKYGADSRLLISSNSQTN